jgi:hypothetical protein
VKAWYDAQHGLVMFELKNGCVFGFPPKGDGYPLLNQRDAGTACSGRVRRGWRGAALEGDRRRRLRPGLLLHLLNVKEWYAK